MLFTGLQMCQHNLLSPENRDASVGTVSDVEWDVTTDKDFMITYKGGEADNKNRER